MRASLRTMIQSTFRQDVRWHRQASKRSRLDLLYRSIGCFVAVSIGMGQLSLIHATSDDTLPAYETYLPHATQADIERVERKLLTAYLDGPNVGRPNCLKGLAHLLGLRIGD
jgi:hypothetical protein